MNTGIVIKSTGSNYLVKTDKGNIIKCKIRGKFRTEELKNTNPVATGDKVSFKPLKEENTGVITEIHKRKNSLTRKSTNLSRKYHVIAANIDYAFLLVTLVNPVTYTVFIDRWTVACEKDNIEPVIIFNKTDLYDETLKQKLKTLIETYEKIPYKCFAVSVKENKGLEKIKQLIKGKTIVISGNSGTGKSSLINALEPGLNIKISEISQYHKQGKHTTTFAEMYDVSGGHLIDTPGIRAFGLDEKTKEKLHNYFPEMKKTADKCKFNNCTHTHEPGCAVKESVNTGEISSLRYNNYINILTDEEEKYRQDKYL